MANPFQTVSKLNDLISTGTILAGDTVAFKKGDSEFDQVFLGSADLTGGSGLPANVTFTSYGAGAFMPVWDSAFFLTGWGGGPDPTPYTKSASSCVWLFEDKVPLNLSASSACAEGVGYFYYDAGATTIYYRPTSGTPATHTVQKLGAVTYARDLQGTTFDGIYFIIGGPWATTNAVGHDYVTITNCKFRKGANIRIAFGNYFNANHITITNNDFDRAYQNSIFLATDDGNLALSGADNVTVTGNKILHNNMLPDDSAWVVGAGGDGEYQDLDCIYAQNWGTATVANNEFSGYVGLGYFSSAIQIFNCMRSSEKVIDSFADDGGLIKVTIQAAITGLQNDDYVFLHSITGAGAPNGKWQITNVLSTTVFSLKSSDSTGFAGWSGGICYGSLPVTPNYTVYNNYAHDVRSAFHLDAGGDYTKTNHRAVVYNNICNNCIGFGINIARPQEAGYSKVVNNTLKDCGTLTWVDQYSSGPTKPGAALLFDGGNNIVIENNIVVGTPHLFSYDQAATGGNTWDYNDYNDAASGSVFQWGATAKTFATWKTATGGESNSITTDPLFVNAGGSYALDTDFKLQAGSPCVNQGIDVGLTEDYYGTGYLSGTFPIGASSGNVVVNFTTYTKNAVLNHILKVGSYTPQTPYLALLTADPTSSGSWVNEANYTGYARQAISFGAASARGITQSGTCTFPQATAGSSLISYWAIADGDTEGAGNMLAYGPLGGARTVAVGTTPIEVSSGVTIALNIGALSTAYANSVLDWLFRGQALAQPANIYVALTSTASTDAAMGTELSGSGYARQQENSWTTSTAGSSSNVDNVTFGKATGTWNQVVGIALLDDLTGGTWMIYGTPTKTITAKNNHFIKFPAGSITITMS